MRKLTVLTLTLCLNNLIFAGNFSYQKSCSGSVFVFQNGSEQMVAFSVSTSVSGTEENGFITTETHNFVLPAFLGSSDNYKLRRQVSMDHVIFEGPKFLLAVPFRNNASLEYLDLGDKRIPGPGEGLVASRWMTLCEAETLKASSSSAQPNK